MRRPPMFSRMSGTPPKRRLGFGSREPQSHRASLLCVSSRLSAVQRKPARARSRVGAECVCSLCPRWLRQMSCGLQEVRTVGAWFCLIHIGECWFHPCASCARRPSRIVRLSATPAREPPFVACAPPTLCTCLSRGAKATRTRPCCKLMWLKYVFCHCTRGCPLPST